MTEGLIIALIAAGAAIAGSLVTGILTYIASIKRNQFSSLRKNFKDSLNDLLTFYYLEEIYVKELSDSQKRSKLSIKREIRKKLRVNKQISLSSFATPLKIKRKINQLN